MSTHTQIEALLARTALKDRTAFDELYSATSAKLLAVTLSVLGTRPAAEDAMQDAYVKIWTHAGRYQQNGLSPMTWMITIARNTAIDRLRRRRSTADIDDVGAALPASDPGPEDLAIASSQAQRLADCLDALPEDRAEAIRGAYLNGLSYADLAEALDRPINTIRTWLRRGLISLRECMSDD